MEQTELVKCSKCKKYQGEDIYGMADTRFLEGEFIKECEYCGADMLIRYQFKPFIETE